MEMQPSTAIYEKIPRIRQGRHLFHEILRLYRRKVMQIETSTASSQNILNNR